MTKRINCLFAGCDCCSEGIYVGKTFILEEKMYRCSHRRGRHKEVDARSCSKFRCNKYSTMDLDCINCRRGE